MGLVALVAASGAMGKPVNKTVIAGPPIPQTLEIAKKLLPKNFTKLYSPDINAFFNKKTTIPVGGSVTFQLAGFHTVDFPAKGASAVPLIVPGPPVSGVNDAAGNPFWFNGLPSAGINPQLFSSSKAKTYDGSQRWDTGAPLGKPKPFKLTFTKAGTYHYFCDIHPGMIGTVVVKPAGAKIPSAKQDAAATVAQITADVKAAAKLAKSKQPADTVSLGESSPGGTELFAMFPSSLTVSPGTTVTFRMSKHTFETHTATFGSKTVLKTLAKGFEGASFPAQGVYPSDQGAITESLTAHGDGFANVGALDNNPKSPLLSSGKITFTQAGTYHFICLIHPNMQGTIIVK